MAIATNHFGPCCVFITSARDASCDARSSPAAVAASGGSSGELSIPGRRQERLHRRPARAAWPRYRTAAGAACIQMTSSKHRAHHKHTATRPKTHVKTTPHLGRTEGSAAAPRRLRRCGAASQTLATQRPAVAPCRRCQRPLHHLPVILRTIFMQECWRKLVCDATCCLLILYGAVHRATGIARFGYSHPAALSGCCAVVDAPTIAASSSLPPPPASANIKPQLSGVCK